MLGVGELAAGIGQPDVAAVDLGEAQQLQRLGDRKQIVDLHVQLLGQRGQVGLAVDRAAPFSVSIRPASRLVETARQDHADADARERALASPALRPARAVMRA